jgi:hypothetical protein
MYGRKERHIQSFGGKPEGKRPLEGPRHRWIILKLIFKKWDGSMDWIWIRIETAGESL